MNRVFDLEVASRLERAFKLFTDGEFGAARGSVHRVLVSDPSNEDALHLIGLVASATKESGVTRCLARLAYLAPGNATHWLNLSIRQRQECIENGEALLCGLVLAPSDSLALTERVRSTRNATSGQDGSSLWIDRLSALQPTSAEVSLVLAEVLLASKLFSQSLLFVERSMAIEPANSRYLSGVASLRSRISQTVDRFYERLCRLSPDEAAAHFAFAEAMSKYSKGPESIAVRLQAAIVCKPEHLPGIHNYGLSLHQSGRSSQAVPWLSRAVQLNPGVSACVADLGWISHVIGDTEDAISILAAAVNRFPLDPRPRQVLGAVALENRAVEDAKRLYTQCLLLDPSASANYNRLAVVALSVREAEGDDAGVPLHRALLIDPRSVDAITNQGILLERNGQFDAACNAHFQALCVGGHLQEPKLNLAICELGLGRFETGWKNYEARWNANSIVLFGRRNLSKRLTTSKPEFTPGARGRVLLWAEQGVGDEIMFASMISDFLVQCDDLILEVDVRMLPLFERSFPRIRCIPRFTEIPDSLYDYQLPIGSLGGIVRSTLSSFEKAADRYLKPDLSLMDEFKHKLGGSIAPVVGLSWWSKNPDSGTDRSIPLPALLDALPSNLTLVNLQYGEEQSAFKRQVIDSDRHTWVDTGIDNENELDRLASIIFACDLVISVGNTTAHLAAALGKPTWVLVPLGGSWRWMFRGASTPWYPSVRLFRRGRGSDWGSVLAEISKELDIFLASKSMLP